MGFYDAILHLDSSDEASGRLVFRNAANYLNALENEKFTLVIVANGGGVSLVLNSRKELRAQAEPVLQKGVKLKVCANALREHNFSKDVIWPECEIVPAGLVEIVRLQKSGFCYIKP